MTTYNIDYSDPLRTGFSINPGEFNGPGGTGTAQTSLRLYGRGALEWGESVDENLVRIHENFAGATAPVTPVGGQLWMRQQLYVMVGSTFYRWNIANSTWATITVTTIAGTITSHTNGTAPGQYVYSTADGKLYRWDSAYKQAASEWLPRALTVQAAAPTTQKPIQDLLYYDAYATDPAKKWITPRAATTGVGLPSSGNYDGQLYYDTSTGVLYIWNEGENAWQQILGPANEVGAPPGGSTIVSSGNIDMQNLYNIINLNYPLETDVTHAAPVGYVNDYVAAAILAATGDITTDILITTDTRYIPKVGPSNMSGAYTLTSGSINANAGSISAGTLTATNGTITTLGATTANVATANLTTANITTGNVTNLVLQAAANANSFKITNLAYATVGTDAANKNYADAVGTSAVNTANAWTTANAIMLNSSAKDGNIHTVGNVAYIWLGGAWRQFWPPLFT
jgi:hypothetical protein